MKELDPRFNENKFGYKKFINFLVDFLDKTKLPYHLEEKSDKTTWVISPGIQSEGESKKSIKMKVHDEELLSSFSKNSISNDEWKAIIDAVERCLNDGEGRYFKGKQWIISAYFHTIRAKNKISFSANFDRAVLLIMANYDLLKQVDNDVFYLSNNFKSSKRAFLQDL